MEDKYDDGKFDLEVVTTDGSLGVSEDVAVQIIKRSNGEAIPYDEPIFIFRARDQLALKTLHAYYEFCRDDGCTKYQLDAILARIAKFGEWRASNPDKMKQPGITEGK